MRNHYVRAAAGGEGNNVEDFFGAVTYTGDNGTDRAITVGSGINFATHGGMVWIKNRDASAGHVLQDTVRGDGPLKRLDLSTANKQNFASTGGHINSFTSSGFKVDVGTAASPDDGTPEETNKSGRDYVAYGFRKKAGFFDIQTWVGNNVNGRQIAHDLDSVPGAIFVKNITSNSNNWWGYHRKVNGGGSIAPENYYLLLNAMNGKTDSVNAWYDTAPTSTHFTIGAQSENNLSGQTYIAYIFAHDDARFGTSEDKEIIKCDYYSGATSARTINLGWKPQFLWISRPNGTRNRSVFDLARGIPSGGDPRIQANRANAEDTWVDFIDVTSTGFTIPAYSSAIQDVNQNNGVFIYIAIRETT